MHTTTVATAGDTWGISGPRFLAYYALGFAVALLVAVVVRRHLLDPRDGTDRRHGAPAGPGPLCPEELALIAGNPKLAVTCTVTGLYDRGLLRPGWRWRRLATTGGHASADLGGFEREVLGTVTAAGELRLNAIGKLVSQGPVMATCRARLQAAGLVPTPAQTRADRWALVPLLVLGVIGAVRAVTGAGRGKPVSFLVVELVVTAIAVVVLASRPTTTRQGRKILAAARRDLAGLRSGGVPGQRALALALFGTSVLWSADPVFASQLGLTRPSSGSDGGSSGGSGCGGGGCGGGGCGG